MLNSLHVGTDKRKQVDGVVERRRITHVLKIGLVNSIPRLTHVDGLDLGIDLGKNAAPLLAVRDTLTKRERVAAADESNLALLDRLIDLMVVTESLTVESNITTSTIHVRTITFHCTPWMMERCGGVVHVDGTARPQLVKKEDNASYYAIIDEYRKLTGVPTIINTSFNIHEEPIVRSPDDAIRAFLDSSLDYLAIDDYLVKGPVGSFATRKKWEGRSKWGACRARGHIAMTLQERLTGSESQKMRRDRTII